MLRYLLLIPLFFLSSLLFSQIQVKEGPLTKRKLGAWHLGFVLADTSQVYTIDDRSLGSPLLSVFDAKTLAFQNEVSLKLKASTTSTESLTHVFSLGEFMYCILEETNEDKTIQVFAKRILRNGQSSEKIFIDTIQQQDLKGDYEIVVNEAEDGFLFVKQSAFQNRAAQNIQVKAYDKNLSNLWKKRINFPDKSVQFVFSNWKYANQNSLAFIARPILDLYKPDREFINMDQNSYFLFNYRRNQDMVREIELSLNNRFINKIDFIQNDTAYIISGYYSNDKNFNPDGVFSVVFDQNFIRKSHSIHNFTETETQLFSAKKSRKSKQKSNVQLKKQFVDELLLRDMLVLESGDFVLLAEEFRKEWEAPIGSNKSENLRSNTYVYYFQNILVFWFDKNGQLVKSSQVEKNQIAREAFNKYNSFVTAQEKNEVLLFFNENPKNLVLDGTERKPTSSTKKMYVKCVRLNEKGKKTTKVITEPSKRKRVLVSLGAQLTNGKVYFQKHKGLSKKSIIEIKLVD